MKKSLLSMFLTSVLLTPAGLSYAQEDHEYAKDVKERTLRVPTCSRPIGTVAARSFTCKAAACRGGVIYFGNNSITTQALGDGLADMLLTALVNTGCFRVLERASMQEIKEELELMGVQARQALKAADFIITGAVTALDMQASGIGGGGGVTLPLPFRVGARVGKSSAHIGLDMRIVNVRGGEIIAARAVEGKSDRWRFGLTGGGLFGSAAASGWFDIFKNTPMEEATRDLIAKAVSLIVEDTKRYAPPNVSVGERVLVYDDKGNVVREQVVMPGGGQRPASQAQPAPAQPAPTQLPQARASIEGQTVGPIRRLGEEFSHYPRILLKEDFSKCRTTPAGFRVVAGSAECVEMGGRMWLSSVKGEARLERALDGFKPNGNWAIEYTVAFGNYGQVILEDHVGMHLGTVGGPLSVRLFAFDGMRVNKSSVSLGTPQRGESYYSLAGKMVKVAIRKRGNTVDVYVDGNRVHTEQVDNVPLGKTGPKLVFVLKGQDINRNMYVLMTDLVVSQE